MTAHIQIEQEGAVLRLRMNRPEKKNALTLAMYTALAEGIARAEADADIRVVMIEGAPSCFTAGNDLFDFMQNPPTGPESPVMGFLQAISTARKPLMAVVQGVAVGIGTTMLLHCDLVYAGRGASFSVPFARLGLVPEAASSLLLPQTVGYHAAAELLLFGDPIDAERACELGIVNAVYDDEAVTEAALGHAQALAERPPASVRLTKQLLKQTHGADVQARIAEEGALFIQRLASPEAAEAMQAFLERRQPDFSSFT